MNGRSPVSLVALLALESCTSPAPAREKPLIHLTTGPIDDRACWVEADGIRFNMDALPQRARAWRGRPVFLDSRTEAPYRCVGGVIFALQMAGVKQIGFISEPPPAEDDRALES